MTNKQKIKIWINNHQEEILLASVIGVGLGVFTIVVIKSSNKQKQMIVDWNNYADMMNAWLNEQHSAGNIVYPLFDGRYLVVAADAFQETVIK